MSYLYLLPDGSDDMPDADGRHTRTVNVLHSAAQFARFPGCADCRHASWFDAHSALQATPPPTTRLRA
jgi:hypothetical protein